MSSTASNSATEAEIDDLADQLREAWDSGMDPVSSLWALLEEKGIRVSRS